MHELLQAALHCAASNALMTAVKAAKTKSKHTTASEVLAGMALVSNPIKQKSNCSQVNNHGMKTFSPILSVPFTFPVIIHHVCGRVANRL